jgi:Family of unknown function (DUF5752)
LQSQKTISYARVVLATFRGADVLSKAIKTNKQSPAKSNGPNLLGTVPYEKGFHFFTELGKYTGITAIGTVEFAEKLQIVPVQSVKFHFQRQDFQKWTEATIGDIQLAKRINQLNSELSDENLRKQILETVQKRLTELQKVAGK